MSTLFSSLLSGFVSSVASDCYYRGMIVMMGTTPIGQRIIDERNRLGWTQGELAQRAGVKRSWLSQVESGSRRKPDAEYLIRIAEKLDVSVEYLVTGERPASGMRVTVPSDAVTDVKWIASLPTATRRAARRALEAWIDGFRGTLSQQSEGEAADQHTRAERRGQDRALKEHNVEPPAQGRADA